MKNKISVAGLVFTLLFLSSVLFGDADNVPGMNIFQKSDESGFGIGYGTVGQLGESKYSFSMGNIQAVYNSESGWHIGQTSAISRSTKWGVPTYTANDVFTLDGSELGVKMDNYTGLDGYHTERENYCRIQYLNRATANSWWQVTSKDGAVSKYGNTADSRIEATGIPAEQPREWVISETRDVYNNIAKYFYNKDITDGDSYLTKIVSGKANATVNGYKATLVYYELKSSIEVSMRQGSRVANSKRVKSVVVVMGCNANGDGGRVLEAYKVNWVESSLAKTSLIGSILRYGTDVIIDGTGSVVSGSSLPAISFNYPQAVSQGGFTSVMDLGLARFIRQGYFYNYNQTHYYNSGKNDILTLPKIVNNYEVIDMNGDGLPDKVHFTSDYIEVSLNNGTGFNNYINCGSLGIWKNKTSYMHLWTGNGCGEFVEGGQVPLMNGSDAVPEQQQEYTVNRVIDMNGDGLPDLVHQDGENTVRVRTNTGSGFGPERDWGGDGFPWKQLGQTLMQNYPTPPSIGFVDLYDINGDGLPDKVADYDASSRNVDICMNNGTGFNAAGLYGYLPDVAGSFMSYLRKTDTSTADWSSITKQEIIDMNGDGLPDKVHCEDANFYVMLNNGHGYVPTVTWLNPGWGAIRRTSVSSDKNNTYVVLDIMDMNGDGLPDLVKAEANRMIVAFNNGNGFNAPVDFGAVRENCLRKIVSTPNMQLPYYRTNNTMIDMLDINGDGLCDQVYIENGSLKAALNTAGSSPDRLLTKVNNGIGGSTEYTYTTADKVNNRGYRFKNWAVKTITIKDGLSGSLTTSYDYFGGLYNSQYRENRGFSKIIQTDPAGNKTEQYYCQDNVNSGLLKKTVVRDAAGYIHSYVSNTYENYQSRPANYGSGANALRVGNGPIMMVNAPQLVSVDSYLVSGTTTVDSGNQPGGSDWKRLKTVMSYDTYGNPAVIENLGEVNADGSDKGYDKKLTQYYYAINEAHWVIVPSEIDLKGQEGQSGTYQNEISKIYYYDNGNAVDSYLNNNHVDWGILKGIYNYDGNRWEVRYGYDAYGNVRIMRDAMGNDTKIGYDNVYDSYPFAVTNAKNYVEKYQYNNLMQVISSVDANNITSSVEYDAFGRVSKVINPGDSSTYPTIENIYQMDGIAPECIKTKHRITSGQSAALSNYSYFDGLGRSVQTKQPGATAGTWITSENWDFISGREHVQAVRTPYIENNFNFSRNNSPTGELTKTKSYLDSTYGSKQEMIYPSLNTSQVFTKQLSTAYVNEKGYGGVENKDGLGNAVETKIYSDTFPFDTLYRTDKMYFRTGTGQLLKQIDDSDQKQITSTCSYNGNGSLVNSLDPDRGTINYTYDANLNVLSDVVGYTYDNLNRMVTKTSSGSIIASYYYDEGGVSASALGKLTRVVDTSGTSEFKYDTQGRLITEIKTITGGGSATINYAYDAMDRLVSITYPDGEVVQQSYDNSGNLAKIGNPTLLDKYLKSVTVNALGQVTESVYGNGAKNSYAYFGAEKNYQLQNAAVKNGSGTLIYNQNYDYDVSGNITSIDAGDISCNQIFNYDFQNRLLSQNNSSFAGGSSIFAYDAVDNILRKNNAYYYYGTSKPHAVSGTSKDPVAFQYDNAGNLARKGLNLSGKDVANFTILVDNGWLTLNWVNPPDSTGLISMRIVRKTGGYPSDPYDGTVIYSGAYSQSLTSFVDLGLANGTTYYYKIFLLDQSANYSAGTGANGMPAVVEYPWSDNEYGTLSINKSWPGPLAGTFWPPVKMGYQFTPTVNGKITKLGAFFNGVNSGGSKLIYLTDNDIYGSVLAYAYVSSLNSWVYSQIAPVNVIANHPYSVYITFDQEWNPVGSQRSGITLPQTFGDIRVLKSFGNFADVNNKGKDTTTEMMGQVDVGFVPDSPTAVAIRAKGTPCQGVWPIMQVYMNSTLVKQWSVNTSDYKLYNIPILDTSDANNLIILYSNDANVPPEDRNLWIDYINVGGKVIQAEDRGVSYLLLSGEKLAGRECMNASGQLIFPFKGIGSKAEYYGNADFTSILAVQTNECIDLDNGSKPLPSNLVNTHSVRWSGQFEAKYNELYTLYTTSYGSVRVWVDGKKVIDNWTFHATIENSCTLNLTAGKRYDIVLEYSTPSSIAVMCSLFWSSTSQPRQIVPQRQLFPERVIKSGSIDFLDPNLSAYWKFDQLPGVSVNTVIDTSKNKNNGLILDTPQWVNGIDGSALSFNGTTSSVCAGNDLSLNQTGNISIEAWVKTPGSAVNQTIVERCNWEQGPYVGYHFFVSQNGSLGFWFGHPELGCAYSATPGKLIDNQWHHVAITANVATSTVTFYIDGVQDGTFSYAQIYSTSSGESLYIGSYKTGTLQSGVFTGSIDEVAVWKKVLTLADIKSRFNCNAKNMQSIANFDMNDGSTTSIKDISGNENNGNINGARFKQTQGICGSGAYEFSWTGRESIAIPYNVSQIATEALTVESWIYPTAWDNPYAGFNRIVSKQPIYLIRGANGYADFVVLTKNYGYQQLFSAYPLALNQWHYVVGTFNGKTTSLYVDGVLQGQSDLPQKDVLVNNDAPISIGENGQLSEGFTGLIDNVIISRRAKTQAEITAVYNQLKNKGIVADWEFNESDGDIFIDASGNGNDGIRDGNVSRIDDGNRRAAHFDGIGSYIKMINSPKLIPSGDDTYTIAAWIKPDVMGLLQCIISWGYPGVGNGVNALVLTGNGFGNLWWYTDMTAVTGDLTGSWHYVVATFDGTTRKLFLDGFCVGKDTPVGQNHTAGLANLAIGKMVTEYFKGMIDNLVVYNRALSEDEVLREYKGIQNNAVYPSLNYSYDKENQLTSISGDITANYTYDFTGTRVKKVEGNSTTYAFNPFYEVENGKIIKHYYAGGSLIADNNDGQLVFYHQDHLGSSARLSDASGNEIKRMGFMPYGENSFISGSGLTPKYQYTGQEKDGSGLYYYGARFYDPELGRFLSVDPLGDNYCYANNKPIMYNDPSGMSSVFQDQYNLSDSYGSGGGGGYTSLPESYFNTGSGYNTMPGLNEMLTTPTGSYYTGAGAAAIGYGGGVVRGAESGLYSSIKSGASLIWSGIDFINNSSEINDLINASMPVSPIIPCANSYLTTSLKFLAARREFFMTMTAFEDTSAAVNFGEFLKKAEQSDPKMVKSIITRLAKLYEKGRSSIKEFNKSSKFQDSMRSRISSRNQLYREALDAYKGIMSKLNIDSRTSEESKRIINEALKKMGEKPMP